MTKERLYDEIVNLIASAIVLGVWALFAWLCAWLFKEPWDRMFLFVIAGTLATNLGSKSNTSTRRAPNFSTSEKNDGT